MENKDKFYTPEQVASKVLEKIQELYKSSKIYKANSAHEVEAGSEPNNDDAECPASLSEGGEASSGDEPKKKKKNQPLHEQGMSDEENFEHDAEENEEDEQDEDTIEADEESEMEEMEEDEEADDEIEEYEEDAEKVISDASEEKKEKKKPFASGEKKENKNPFAKNMSNGAYGAPMAKPNRVEDMKIDIKKKPSKLKKFLDKKSIKKKCMGKNMAAADAPQDKQSKQDVQKPQEKPVGPAGSGY